jgi:DNA polymerase III sliding clamp (beta) subunit (PCNA family)
MEKMDLDQLVKQMAFEGKGFDEIHAELNALKSRFEDDEIRLAIRKIDTYIVQYQMASLEKSKGKNFMILGAILFTLGISLTIYTY